VFGWDGMGRERVRERGGESEREGGSCVALMLVMYQIRNQLVEKTAVRFKSLFSFSLSLSILSPSPTLLLPLPFSLSHFQPSMFISVCSCSILLPLLRRCGLFHLRHKVFFVCFHSFFHFLFFRLGSVVSLSLSPSLSSLSLSLSLSLSTSSLTHNVSTKAGIQTYRR